MSTNRLIGILTTLSCLAGLAGGVAAFGELHNYFQSLRFFILFGSIGFISGLLLWRRLRKKLEETTPAELRKGFSGFGLVIGCIGLGLYLGTLLNTAISSSATGNCAVLEKRYTPAAARSGAKYYLNVNISNKPTLVMCSYDYWNSLNVGDTVSVTFNESPIGFDYVILPSDE